MKQEMLEQLFNLDKILKVEEDRIKIIFDDYEIPWREEIYEYIHKILWINSDVCNEIEDIWIYNLIKINNDWFSIKRFKEYNDLYDLYSDNEIDIKQKIMEYERILKAYYVYKLKNL